MKIYIGGLASDLSEAEVRAVFEPFGAVTSVALMRDRVTGKPKGFAFVEMPNPDEAKSAIAGLHGKDLRGRVLVVNEARAPSGGPRR